MWKELREHLASSDIRHEKGILKVEYMGDYVLQIWFEETLDVSIYELDFLPILSADDTGSALRPLLDQDWFRQAVGRENITWFDRDTGDYNENAIDISPEAIRWLSVSYGKILKS